MKVTTNSTETLEWEIEGIEAKAEITSQNNDHKLTMFRWDQPGKGVDGTSSLVVILNEEVMRGIHKALSELVEHMDRKRGVGNVSNVITVNPLTGTLRGGSSRSTTSGHDSIQ